MIKKGWILGALSFLMAMALWTFVRAAEDFVGPGMSIVATNKTTGKSVQVEVGGESDPVPASEITFILDRTDGFCREEGRPGVRKILIVYNAKEQASTVMYQCIGDLGG